MATLQQDSTSGAVAQLVSLSQDYTGHDLSYDDVRQAQVAALDERLQQRIDAVKLIKLRSDEAGISRIASLEDAVPLLLPHTAYKSYPERFLTEQRWDKLTKWLATVSTPDLKEVDLSGIADLDEWVERLASYDHYLACSSGTTGNPAMLLSSKSDVEFASTDIVKALLWGSEIEPDRSRTLFSVGLVTRTPRGTAMFGALRDTLLSDRSGFALPIPPITIGTITSTIALRKAIAAGTAQPDEIARFDKEAAERQQMVDAAFSASADAAIAARGEPLYFTGYWGQLYQLAREVRERGFSGADFNLNNAIYLAGGLKKASLPADYLEFVLETFNLQPKYIYQMYGMQEIQTCMPRCQEGGRYHVPAWLVCLPLDKDGDKLLSGVGAGVVEGRAAFFDLSIEGRWGGVISGDHIQIDYSPCACGAKSPSIRDDIYRYSDLKGDDKIACSGTIDAYVRGVT